MGFVFYSSKFELATQWSAKRQPICFPKHSRSVHNKAAAKEYSPFTPCGLQIKEKEKDRVFLKSIQLLFLIFFLGKRAGSAIAANPKTLTSVDGDGFWIPQNRKKRFWAIKIEHMEFKGAIFFIKMPLERGKEPYIIYSYTCMYVCMSVYELGKM